MWCLIAKKVEQKRRTTAIKDDGDDDEIDHQWNGE